MFQLTSPPRSGIAARAERLGRNRLVVAALVAVLVVISAGVVVDRAGDGAVVGGDSAEAPSPRAEIGVPGQRDTFPDASSTGVPERTQLTRYRGPCTITEPGTVIDSRVVDCRLVVRASDVTVSRSRVNGPIEVDGEQDSLLLTDSEVDAGTAYEAAVGYSNTTVLRSEVRGGSVSVLCGSNCTVQDSWLHGQYLAPDADWHLNAFLSNGGADVSVVHNTLACDARSNATGGGCTASASVFGDFSANTRYTFHNNLLQASPEQSYCAYSGSDPGKPFGDQVQEMIWTDNVFERGDNGRCGQYGPVTSFDPSASGNVWSGNVWDDGRPVEP